MKNKLKKLQKDSFLSALMHRYSSTLFVQLAGFMVGMVVAKLLGPEMLGIWGLFQIVTNYYSYTNLGATNGLTRSLGMAIGMKDEQKIKDTIGAANAIQLSLPALVSIGLIIVGFFLGAPKNWIFAFAGIAGFIKMYGIVMARILNAFEMHKVSAKLQVIRSLFSFIIIIPLVYFFEIKGRIYAMITLAIIMTYLYYRKLPVKLSIKFDRKLIFEHIKVGLPIAAAGFLAANLFLVDRIIITKFLSLEALGLYVFGFYLVNMVRQVKQVIVSILYQRQNIVFGQDGSKTNKLYEISKSAALFTTDITGIVSGFALIAFSFFVKHFMPEYIDALPLTFVVVFSQAIGSINVLNSVGKQMQYLAIIFSALLFNIILSIAFVHVWGLIGVAYATFISFLLYNTVVTIINMKFFKIGFKERFLINIRILIIPLYSFFNAKVIEYFILKHADWGMSKDAVFSLALMLLYCIALIPLFFLIKKDIKILNKIKLGVS